MNVAQVLDSKGSGKVFTVPESMRLKELIHALAERRVGAFLVAGDDGSLAGIVSERDVIRSLATDIDPLTVHVRDIMTRSLIGIPPDRDIHEAMDLMVSKRIRHLPVMDGGTPCGLITVRDLIETMRKADRADVDQLVAYLESEIKERN